MATLPPLHLCMHSSASSAICSIFPDVSMFRTCSLSSSSCLSNAPYFMAFISPSFKGWSCMSVGQLKMSPSFISAILLLFSIQAFPLDIKIEAGFLSRAVVPSAAAATAAYFAPFNPSLSPSFSPSFSILFSSILGSDSIHFHAVFSSADLQFQPNFESLRFNWNISNLIGQGVASLKFNWDFRGCRSEKGK